MSAHKHTPGPWEQADAFGVTPTGTSVKAASDNYLVASCTGYYGRDGAVANARLIAAAPELLEALEPFAHATLTRSGQVVGLMREDFERALAAIVKATGESA